MKCRRHEWGKKIKRPAEGQKFFTIPQDITAHSRGRYKMQTKICRRKVPPSLYKLLANNTPFFISFCQTLISFWVFFFLREPLRLLICCPRKSWLFYCWWKLFSQSCQFTHFKWLLKIVKNKKVSMTLRSSSYTIWTLGHLHCREVRKKK